MIETNFVVQERNMIFQTNEFRKQEGLAIPIYDKIEFRPKFVKMCEKDHFILIQRTIHRYWWIL